jgi:hypothetical protein
MKNLIVTLLLLLTSCYAWADSPATVELPSQYKAEQVQALIHSIDFQQLARDADKSVPGVLDKSVPGVFKAKVGFYFQPLTFHSFLGQSDHMAIRIDVHAPPGWGKESELKAYLANYLVRRFPGSKSTTTVFIPSPASKK